MILGVGSFAQSIGRTLADAGAGVSTYLTRNYGHFPPSLVGPTFLRDAFPSPVPLIKKNGVNVVIPNVQVRFDECIGCKICVHVCERMAWDAIEMWPTEQVEQFFEIKMHDKYEDAVAAHTETAKN